MTGGVTGVTGNAREGEWGGSRHGRGRYQKGHVDTLLRLFGFAFLALGAAAAVVALWAAAKEVRRPTQGDPTTRLFDPVEAVKALATAPLWLALAVVGAGLIILAAMFDGYRFADGGMTQAPAAATALGT